jgi:hypothetical protein
LSCIDPTVRIVTKFLKVGPLFKFSISLIVSELRLCRGYYLSMPNVSVPGMLTGLELRKPELTRPCEMELPEQLRDFPPSPPRPEQFRDFSPSENPLDCRDLLPSYRSVMLISSKPEAKKE